MSKIKLSDSDKRLLVIFFAVVIVACSYFFIFTKGMAKAAKIEEQNVTDRQTVQNMEAMEAGLPKVKENIQLLKQKQADIIAKYPSDLTTEKVIYILQNMEDDCDFEVTSITFLMDAPMQVTTADNADAVTENTDDTTADATTDTESTEAADTDATDTAEKQQAADVRGYYASIGVEYNASYDGLKAMLKFFNEYSDRIAITATTATYDSETGGLTGNMTINMYYITETGKDYIPPKFNFMEKGVDSIFGGTTGEDTTDSSTDSYGY